MVHPSRFGIAGQPSNDQQHDEQDGPDKNGGLE